MPQNNSLCKLMLARLNPVTEPYSLQPCGFGWGDKHKWEAASKEWSLPSMPLKPLWEKCSDGKRKCPPI